MNENARMRRVLLTVPVAVPAVLAVAGCGSTKVTTSNRPATVPAASPAATGSPLRTGSFTGQSINTKFGPVQVGVTVTGGHMTDVTFLALPNDRPRSQFISQQAGPLLRSEALQAQSASINLLSGASYTSEGFAESLQSALAQAR
jgi:uncharacterized protein with FMN-binding domain